MSYARFSEGDVYVYDSGKTITCSACRLIGDGFSFDMICDTPAQMLAHPEQHIAAGHHVPERAIERLKEERGDNR